MTDEELRALCKERFETKDAFTCTIVIRRLADVVPTLLDRAQAAERKLEAAEKEIKELQADVKWLSKLATDTPKDEQ